MLLAPANELGEKRIMEFMSNESEYGELERVLFLALLLEPEPLNEKWKSVAGAEEGGGP